MQIHFGQFSVSLRCNSEIPKEGELVMGQGVPGWALRATQEDVEEMEFLESLRRLM